MALQDNDFAFLLPEFPLLQDTGFQITSNPDRLYNCIAWAANDTSKWWWPDQEGDGYWPGSITREETLEAFVAAYGTLGYGPCDNGNLEEGYEKVAIYANQEGPTHVARQLPNGNWTSKLGPFHDIEHNTLDGVNGACYGAVVIILKR